MMVYNLEISYIKKIKEDIVVNFLPSSLPNPLKKKRSKNVEKYFHFTAKICEIFIIKRHCTHG